MLTLALDIGGTKFQLALFREAETGPVPEIVRRHRQATDREQGRPWMLEQIALVCRAWQSESAPDRIARAGIGFGGPVDFHKQRVALSTHVEGWQNFDLRDWLAETLELSSDSVVLDNDANAGALGEAGFGAGKHLRPLLYVTLSTGIGGGLILDDGSLLRGADCWAGEIGHIALDPAGPECLCGSRGCFERLCGGLWLERDHGRSAEQLLADPAFLKNYAVQVARGLKPALMLLNPGGVVIGGGIAKTGPALFEAIEQSLETEMPPWSGARRRIVPAALGDDSILWGAYALAARLAV